MSTHPTILGDLITNETGSEEKTSLDVERDLAIPAGPEGETSDPARDLAIPPSGLPPAGREPEVEPVRKQSE